MEINRLIEARITKLNTLHPVLINNGGLWQVLIDYLHSHKNNNIINNHNNLTIKS